MLSCTNLISFEVSIFADYLDATPFKVKKIIASEYARFFGAGLALTVICAWFSAGFHQVDEHFQVLEFCSYKMGNISSSVLPWEFGQKMRPALLPGIAYLIAKTMTCFSLYNPFIVAFLLRFITGIAAWYIACLFCILFSSRFKTPTGQKFFILMSLFLWFIPYLSVRFTPENISGIVFLYGVYNILQNREKESTYFLTYLLAGLLFGIAFFIRFQMIFAIAGFVAWLLFIKKIKWKPSGLLFISFLVGIGLNIFIDYWFYGTWTLTPLNYYYANVVQHRADIFGINPWWFYVPEFLMKGFPPLSFILLVLFFTGVLKNRKDPLIWAIIPFILAHFIVGHKELRFLFPVTFMFIYSSALGLDYLLTKKSYLKIHKYVYVVSLIICIPLLLYRVFSPANISISYCRFLYTHISKKNTPVFICNNTSDYSMYGMNDSFYRNPDVKVISIDSLSQLNKYIEGSKPPVAFFLDKNAPLNGVFNYPVNGYKTEMSYCFFPSWVSGLDINNWEKRTQIWKVYKFTKIQEENLKSN